MTTLERRVLSPDKQLEKLTTIGIASFTEYQVIATALRNGDVPELKMHQQITHGRVAESEVASTHLEYKGWWRKYSIARRLLHRQLIAAALQEPQKEKRKKGTHTRPTLVIIGGPPAAGKSSTRESLTGDSGVRQFVLTDPDIFRYHLLPGFDYAANHQGVRATNAEAFDISDKLVQAAFRRNLSLVAEGSWRNSDWCQWLVKRALRKGYNVKMAFVYSSLAECFERSIQGERRAVDLNMLLSSVEGWNTLADMQQLVRSNQQRRGKGHIELSVVQHAPMGGVEEIFYQSSAGEKRQSESAMTRMYEEINRFQTFSRKGSITPLI